MLSAAHSPKPGVEVVSQEAMALAIYDREQLIPLDQIELTPTALTVVGRLNWEQWVALGQALTAANQAIQWWIGDYLNQAETEWHDTYIDLMEATGMAKSTIANWKWVAGQMPPERRRSELTWSHHLKAVQLLPGNTGAQDTFLRRAAASGQSVRRLEAEIQRAKGERTAPTLYEALKQTLDQMRADRLDVEAQKGVDAICDCAERYILPLLQRYAGDDPDFRPDYD